MAWKHYETETEKSMENDVKTEWHLKWNHLQADDWYKESGNSEKCCWLHVQVYKSKLSKAAWVLFHFGALWIASSCEKSILSGEGKCVLYSLYMALEVELTRAQFFCCNDCESAVHLSTQRITRTE